MQAAIAAANRIARFPYRYGGGHRSFHDSGYDCSGSVSYVLHAMGALRSPLDSSALMGYGAPGPGRYVTVYANPGHAYMTINGRRFDTSAQWQGGSRWRAQPRSARGYMVPAPRRPLRGRPEDRLLQTRSTSVVSRVALAARDLSQSKRRVCQLLVRRRLRRQSDRLLGSQELGFAHD